MSEWIKREDREPPHDQFVLWTNARRNDENTCWVGWDSDGPDATHWMPLPDPPSRMVTIEISWDLAQTAYENSRDWPMNSSWRKLGDACAKALEDER